MTEAKTKLSKLVKAAEQGKQVVPLPKRDFPYGFLKDDIGKVPDDLLFSSPAEEYADFYKQ